MFPVAAPFFTEITAANASLTEIYTRYIIYTNNPVGLMSTVDSNHADPHQFFNVVGRHA
jgi:hypothetical protein